ncbi:MAG: hypothetical protein Ct9H300mP25_16230 [Acidobacteriota bacterium]|nr:MAG: hypothetical protein Ct9H300mP25_16230 [Acidobacteriota bacterium]
MTATPPNDNVDLIEWYFEKGVDRWLPVSSNPEKVAAMIESLGGEPDHLEAGIPPRGGSLTREVLAINLVLAGCLPAYPKGFVRAAVLALASPHFNLNGVQATTHMAAPLLLSMAPFDRHSVE